VRKEFRSIRLANRPRTLAALRELRMARANLAAAQQASPFDEAAVKDAMAAVRTEPSGDHAGLSVDRAEERQGKARCRKLMLVRLSF
jgi:hypothetical protein